MGESFSIMYSGEITIQWVHGLRRNIDTYDKSEFNLSLVLICFYYSKSDAIMTF